MYKLSKYKGIQYFRYTFFFFGLAYLTRFLFHLLKLGFFVVRNQRALRIYSPLTITLVGYFSTMAIFYLLYSQVWKKFKFESFIIFSNLLAAIIAIISFSTKSPIIISLVQLPIIIAIIYFAIKKKSPSKTLYILTSLFWFINLFLLSPGKFIPKNTNIFFHILSIIVFGIIYHKVSKWTK